MKLIFYKKALISIIVPGKKMFKKNFVSGVTNISLPSIAWSSDLICHEHLQVVCLP